MYLVTTGWSAFVNKKKLVSGDAVIFHRSGDGELRLGIRRAAQAKLGSPCPPSGPFNQHLNVSGILDVVNVISTRGIFSVCYHPRYTGLVIGIGDVDPVRWPSSKWRSLLVRWDDADDTRHNRVSPWEIEPSGAFNMGVPAAKRARVLQGQEIFAVNKPYDRPMYLSGFDHSEISTRSRNIRALLGDTGSHSQDSFGFFAESCRFNKVLQGQETYPTPLYSRWPNHQSPMPPPSSSVLGPQSSCRIFGFPLLEGRSAAMTKESGPFNSTSSHGETDNSKPQVMSGAIIGIGYPKVNDPYASREVLLDIAL